MISGGLYRWGGGILRFLSDYNHIKAHQDTRVVQKAKELVTRMFVLVHRYMYNTM